ncbi:MAG TPA: chemotaxis protein CheW [Opitutaceae bacterium]|jgi:two-component system chemotaxis sensor kinase CheA
MKSDLQQQFIRDMVAETDEGLDRYDTAILRLEKGDAPPDTLNEIFRVVHTLKGTAGCLGFHSIEKLAHAGESLMDALRTGTLGMTPDIASGLLKLSESLRRLLRRVDTNGNDGPAAEIEAQAGQLLAMRDESAATDQAGPVAGGVDPGDSAFDVAGAGVSAPGYGATAPDASTQPAVAWGLFDDAPGAPAEAPAALVSAPAPVAKAVPATPAADASTAAANNSTVRVDVALLDRLMNLVGELVLSRNQLTQIAQSRTVRPESVLEISQRINLVTAELQEGVMKTRMQPIGNVWAKFPRVVREVARELGKEVRLDLVGSNTELDRTILESIRDPLTHIVRNSIDHGIESPARRAEAGKPPEGHLIMRAFHEGGQVNIEIVDDGAGIDLARVKQKALNRGLITAEEGARLSDRDATALIFLPGLSTAEKITRVSGRGVGMDVVKTNIEKIGGSVDVQSTLGRGTSIKIKIPLTLAIVPALIVHAGGERFAIPQVSLVELVRLEGESAARGIERVYDTPVFRLRGNLLPLVFLQKELALPPAAEPDSAFNIVVLQADRRSFGLVVDAISDTEEIVVKPLDLHLKGLPMFAGATIMGDGRPALILDALGVAQHAKIVGDGQEHRGAEGLGRAADSAGQAEGKRTQWLLFSLPGRDRLALPLDQAARLEEFPAGSIERSGGREAVQYRGQIMPLVRLSQHVGGTTDQGASEPLRVIVYHDQGRSVGLVVGQIHDIVEHDGAGQKNGRAPGLLGSAVIGGRITDLIDVPAILHA